MRPRVSVESLWIVALLGGAAAGLVGDRLSMSRVREAGIAMVFLAAAIFGLDMVLKRRAEIATRYSSAINPRFHVFRGWAAVAWGVSIGLFSAALVAIAVIQMTDWSAAKEHFNRRPGLVVVLGGVIITAWGMGSAGRATYLVGKTETPARRLGDRLSGLAAVPLGLAVVMIGVLQTAAPSIVDAVRKLVRDWFFSLVPR
jgi:hypothetical protein